MSEKLERLERLGSLLDDQKIDRHEYESLKVEILGSAPSPGSDRVQNASHGGPQDRLTDSAGSGEAHGTTGSGSRAKEVWGSLLVLVGISGFVASTVVTGDPVNGLLNPLTYLTIWGFVLLHQTRL